MAAHLAVAWGRKPAMSVRFGLGRLDNLVVWGSVFSVLLTAFNTWQHDNAISFVTTQPSAWPMAVCMGLFFSGQVACIGVFRQFIRCDRMAILAGFLSAHIALILLTYLSQVVAAGALGVLGLAGGVTGLFTLVRGRRWGSALWFLGLLPMIPLVWFAIGWILFALPHGNHFTVFALRSGPTASVVDLQHQLAYVQMIHNYGVPSVGLHGLGYHYYHWLVGYPISSIARASGLDVLLVHGNFMPGITAPMLIQGLVLACVLAARTNLQAVFAICGFVLLYLVISQVYEPITFGLTFLSPSTTYSLALFAPLAGVAIWFFSGNLSQVRPLHFVVFCVACTLVGLAKVPTLPVACILVGSLALFPFMRAKSRLVGRGLVAACIALIAATAMVFLWEILQHQLKFRAPSEAYLDAVSALSPEHQQALLDNRLTALALQTGLRADRWTEYEASVFWRSKVGFAGISVTLLMTLALLGLGRRSIGIWRWLAVVPVAACALLIVQRVFLGFPTPTQAFYVLSPAVIVGGLALFVLSGRAVSMVRIPNQQGSAGTPISHIIEARPWSLPAVSVAAVLLVAMVTWLPAQQAVQSAGAGRAVASLGRIANDQGRTLIGQLTWQRLGNLGLGRAANWPVQANRYWEVAWEQQPVNLRAKEWRDAAAEAANDKEGVAALFLPANDEYWQKFKTSSAMFWVPGYVGVPLYRGLLNPTGKLPESDSFDAKLAYSGRGISDYSLEAAGQLISEQNIILLCDLPKPPKIASIIGLSC